MTWTDIVVASIVGVYALGVFARVIFLAALDRIVPK